MCESRLRPPARAWLVLQKHRNDQRALSPDSVMCVKPTSLTAAGRRVLRTVFSLV